MQVVGPILYVGGDFQDSAGIPTADYLLACDLASGAPSATTVDPAHLFSGPVKALTATSDGTLALFSLTQIIAYPTVTQGSGPAPDADGHPSPASTPGRARRHRARHVAWQSADQAGNAQGDVQVRLGERRPTFFCKLDKRKLTCCTSPKTYKKLAPGGHVFRVRARDPAGNLDATPAVTRFKIKQQ